jgi:hypothetical protein
MRYYDSMAFAARDNARPALTTVAISDAPPVDGAALTPASFASVGKDI